LPRRERATVIDASTCCCRESAGSGAGSPRILKGLFDSYYADVAKPVIFDTNRAWTAQLPGAEQGPAYATFILRSIDDLACCRFDDTQSS